MSTTANDDDRVNTGRAVYARNFQVSEDIAEATLMQRAGAQYTREAFLAAGGPGWNGVGLTDRDRSIAVIAALVSQHVTDQRLITYLNAARTAGVTEEGLADLMVLLTAYLGQPAPSVAMANRPHDRAGRTPRHADIAGRNSSSVAGKGFHDWHLLASTTPQQLPASPAALLATRQPGAGGTRGVGWPEDTCLALGSRTLVLKCREASGVSHYEARLGARGPMFGRVTLAMIFGASAERLEGPDAGFDLVAARWAGWRLCCRWLLKKKVVVGSS